MSNHKQKRTLQELDLLDRFLFARVIEDTETYQAMLEILLGEEIHLLNPSQTEKEFRTAPWLRSIRVDVYSMDEKGTFYTSETQKKNTYNLPKRSRYYSSLMDSSILAPGSDDFNELNDSILIMITPFDLFGYGKYRYTFQMECKEVPGLMLEDGTKRIFFNTKGMNKDEVSPELVELLKYFEHTAEKKEERSDVKGIRKIQEQVKLIKSSEEMGVRYMQEWEEKKMMVDEARQEGIKETTDRINTLNQKLIEAGRVEDLKRTTTDQSYQEQLFEEFGL